MKFAYLIFAHQQPELFIRLIKKIDSAESIFFIHIDKRVDIAPFKEIEKFIAVRKIVWIKRASIVWAGFNQIRVTLAGLRAVLDYPEKISHVTFISGQDYPVKPILEYHRYLSQSNEANFIEYSSLPRPNWANGGLDRIHYYHLLFTKFRLAFPIISYLKIKLPFTAQNKYTLLRKVVNYLPSSKKFPRKFLTGYIPYEGSNWFTFSTSLVRDIFHELETNKKFYRYFKYTHHPDEIFFQTLILNRLPKQVEKTVNQNLTYVEFDKTTGRPFNLTIDFFEKLKNTNRFFARKFEEKESHSLLEKIDTELLNTGNPIRNID